VKATSWPPPAAANDAAPLSPPAELDALYRPADAPPEAPASTIDQHADHMLRMRLGVVELGAGAEEGRAA
jgi:hypothetical protein